MRSTAVNRQWRLVSRPQGPVRSEDFRYSEESVPAVKEGEALVRSLYISFDPAMRGWMDESPSYAPPVEVGGVMRAFTAGVVVESKHPTLRRGDHVLGTGGWQDYYIPQDTDLMPAGKIPEGVPLTASLGLFGLNGLTAYFGLLEIGRPRAGETVVVSAAAGATGLIACGIAKLRGCRVIGVAGGAEKCRFLMQEAGIDAAIDYKAGDVEPRLRDSCPKGIDVFFDNVGGAVLDAALANLAQGARVVLCGAISTYDALGQQPGPRNYVTLIIRRARMEGFLVLDYLPRMNEALGALADWVREGRLCAKEDVQQGFENIPATFLRLFRGENIGKQLLKLDEA